MVLYLFDYKYAKYFNTGEKHDTHQNYSQNITIFTSGLCNYSLVLHICQ